MEHDVPTDPVDVRFLEPGRIDQVPQARMPIRVPVVLSRDEVSRILRELTGKMWIIGVVPYGAGLRIQDCLGLPCRAGDARLEMLIGTDRHDIICNMKTIAITMDEATLEQVDRLVRLGHESSRNRSQLIREAVRAHVAKLQRLTDDEREGAVVRRHRGRLARQASALVREQAKP